jgi:site-specific recombinase
MPIEHEAIRRHIDAFVRADTLTERSDAFVALVRWTRRGWDQRSTALGDTQDGARVDRLIEFLENADERRRFQVALGELLAETDGTNALAHAGIPSERGFLAELGERVTNKVLPRPRNDHDLGTLVRLLIRSDADVGRLARMPQDRLARLADVLCPAHHPAAIEKLRRSFANGFRLLATWVKAQGLSPKIRKRSRPGDLTESPFCRISSVSETVVERWLTGQVTEVDGAIWRRECEQCRQELVEIHHLIEREGVSTHVVYGLEVIERCLVRMSAMVDVMASSPSIPQPEALRRVLVALATSVHQDRSVRHLMRWNTHLLLRRIVERSGRTGEHYIAATPAEYRHMWLAAAGGGLLTVGTAAIKTALSGWHMSDFAHGMMYGLNYAISFLLLQRFGLVLATKQPAMTAAALATIVRDRKGEDRANEIADYTARICRSQLAAVVGNVIVVSAGAFAFVHLWQFVIGRPFMTGEEASAVYVQLSPLNSGTVFYAALTGVILWFASVIGGWFDNLCAYHRLPLAIAQHPAGHYLKRERLARWGESLAENGSGWATNLSLGFMLGMTPAIGHFLGLPLDVRHVTLNSGILSLASAALGQRWFGEGAFILGIAGIGVMFVLNLGVSFLLALITAQRAYELSTREKAAVLGALYRHFKNAPFDFLIPPREERERSDAQVSV